MSIFDGAEAIINQCLFGNGSLRYKQKTSLLLLSRGTIFCPDPSTLVRQLYENTVDGWRKQSRRDGKVLPPRRPSKENWRFILNTKIRPDNPSREKQVEKKIALLAEQGKLGLDQWANQVPVASGLLDEHKDKKASIDLVNRVGPCCFDLIELKMHPDSGHVLFAVMEALLYGVLFLFSKRSAADLGYICGETDILGATRIRLVVLAPADYYHGVPQTLLNSLCSDLNVGLAAECAREGAFQTSIEMRIEQFPKSFEWPCCDDGLIRALLGRHEVLKTS